MKPRTALVLSAAGILFTGAAALAANTYTLNSTNTSTLGNGGSVLVPDISRTPTPAPVLPPSAAVASPQATPDAAGQPSTSTTTTGQDDSGTPTTQPGAVSGGDTATTQPGTVSGGGVATQTGDDKGGLRGGSGGHGSDD